MMQKLSPQQIQLMKLLQIPTATLDQRIKEELEANPALEEGEDELEDPFGTKDNEESAIVEETEEADLKEEDFELDEYLNEYLDDDPTCYKENIS